MTKKLTYAMGDGWEAIYIDDEKVFESHEPNWGYFFRDVLGPKLGFDVDFFWAQDQLDEEGCFPDNPADLRPDE